MTDKKMTSQTPIVIRKRICYNWSLREFFNNIHRILRGQNWINRQQNIRFQFTLSCLHTVLKNDEKADFKKQKIKKIVTYISQSNKVVFFENSPVLKWFGPGCLDVRVDGKTGRSVAETPSVLNLKVLRCSLKNKCFSGTWTLKVLPQWFILFCFSVIYSFLVSN